ncbi:MAG: hypothetical protein HC926_00590 [Synechococcaceae cyanobacterium SM2_3_60]|nr:hypothetical protein [Synechococcaceae cyanobacterium SM2_3_60]
MAGGEGFAMQKVLISGMLLLSLAAPVVPVWAQDATAVTSEADPEVTRLLTEYARAIANLPPLPNLQFRQQVQVTGEQDYAATLDVLYREDGSWQSWLAEGDRVRLLDSRQAAFSSGNDLLQLYSTYVDQADSLILEGTLRLDAAAGSYPEATVADAVVNEQAVHHIVLNNTTGQVRELWLDPTTFLPIQALLQIRDRGVTPLPSSNMPPSMSSGCRSVWISTSPMASGQCRDCGGAPSKGN